MQAFTCQLFVNEMTCVFQLAGAWGSQGQTTGPQEMESHKISMLHGAYGLPVSLAGCQNRGFWGGLASGF